MSETHAPHSRPIITTGRLSTRMNEDEQAELTARLQPYLLTPECLAAAKAANQMVEVELGIGNGQALYARAAANPNGLYIGSEIYLNGLRSLVSQLKANPLPNLRIYPHDGRTLFENGLLAPASLARVLILFPDPWPKSSHHKRRIVQPELATRITSSLKPAGELWVVSDWPSYAYHAIATLHPVKGLKLAPVDLAAADCKPSARLSDDGTAAIGPHLLENAPTWWQPTKYQEKAAIAGRNPWFIKAVKSA